MHRHKLAQSHTIQQIGLAGSRISWCPSATRDGGPKVGAPDERAEIGGVRARRGEGRTAGGVDANATEKHLMELARDADVRGRSTMTKAELVEALQKANDRATAAARR